MINRNKLIQFCNIYIMKELYSRGYIKSKSLTVTSSSTDLVNKIMHICKSNINKIIKEDKKYSDFIIKTSFSKGTLSIFHNLDTLYHKNIYFTGLVRDVAQNSTDFENKVFKIMETFSGFRFQISPIVRAFEAGSFNGYTHTYNSEYDIKEILDTVINGITSIDVKFKYICSHFEEISKFNQEYEFSLEDFYFMVRGLRYIKPEIYPYITDYTLVRDAGHKEELKNTKIPINNNAFILSMDNSIYNKHTEEDEACLNEIKEIIIALRDRLGVLQNV